MRSRAIVLSTLVCSGAAVLLTQPPSSGANLRAFIAVDRPLVALTHARVIDGTGAPAREGQTLVIRDGTIAAVGSAPRVSVPADATAIDLTGKTVILQGRRGLRSRKADRLGQRHGWTLVSSRLDI